MNSGEAGRNREARLPVPRIGVSVAETYRRVRRMAWLLPLVKEEVEEGGTGTVGDGHTNADCNDLVECVHLKPPIVTNSIPRATNAGRFRYAVRPRFRYGGRFNVQSPVHRLATSCGPWGRPISRHIFLRDASRNRPLRTTLYCELNTIARFVNLVKTYGVVFANFGLNITLTSVDKRSGRVLHRSLSFGVDGLIVSNKKADRRGQRVG